MAEQMISAWKALHFKDLTNKIAPIHWDIDLTMICNHRCKGCFYIGLPEDGFDSGQEVYRNMTNGSIMPTELALSIIKQISENGGKAITFVGGGEPTLHPKVVDIFNHVNSLGLKFGLISHLGLNYKPEFFDALLNATWVRVSVNAATFQTYNIIQGIKKPDEFTRVCKNIEQFSKMGGNVGVSFLIHPDTYKEISLAANIFKMLGAKYIQYKPYITDKKNELWNEITTEISHLLDEAKNYHDDTFKVFDQFSSRKEELNKYWNKESCGKCWVANFNPKVTANGKLYQCCELAYSDHGLLGDLNTTSIKELIESGAWEREQNAIDTNKCPPCWERSLNKSINDGSFHSMKPPIETLDKEFV